MTSTNMPSTMPPHNQPQPINPKTFRTSFTFVKEIGHGTEGTVSRWENPSTGQVVALKVPRDPRRSKDLLAEIAALQKVPPNEHINNLLTYILAHEPIGPALVFELAQWGDVYQFRKTFLRYTDKVPEMTLWKFLKDLSLGLDWLHNKMGEAHIHGDLKPENILVFSPSDWKDAHDKLPALPTFKISDIARMLPAKATKKYNGTYEYAPPIAERERNQTLAADVWAIGASLQYFALGTLPVMDKYEYIKEKKEQGGAVPTLEDLKTEAWRKVIPPQYRPLHMSLEYQLHTMKVEHPAQYSFDLQRWYEMLYTVEPSKRISSKMLVKQFVPYAQVKIQTLIREQEQERARQIFLRELEHRNLMGLRAPEVLQNAAAVLQETRAARAAQGAYGNRAYGPEFPAAQEHRQAAQEDWPPGHGERPPWHY